MPPKPKARHLLKQPVVISLTPAERRELDGLAKRLGMTRSALVLALLRTRAGTQGQLFKDQRKD